MVRDAAFNTGNQSKATWVERAALACDLLAPAVAADEIASISDVGCGDEKVRRLIDERGWHVRYRGFDLVPQSEAVELLDLNLSAPAGHSDAAIALGLLEYVDDIGACLRRLAEHAPRLVVSHTVRDGSGFGKDVQKERGWNNHLLASEFAHLLASNRWRIMDVRTTSNRLTRIWLAERTDEA